MILITRPEKEGRDLTMILENRNYECFHEPMLNIKYLKPDWYDILNEPVQSFITTSKNAKRFAPLGQPLATIPQQGKNAFHLYQWIIKNLNPDKAKLVYLRGDIVSFDMAETLRTHGFKVQEIITYQAVPPQEFTEEFLNNIPNIKLALFFSANSLNNFLALVDKYRIRGDLKKMNFLCISEEAAEELKDYKIQQLYIANTPDLTGMINKIDEIY